MSLAMVAVWLQAAGGMLGALGGLPLMLLFVIAMYFFLVLPNQRKQKSWQEMLGKLKQGDQVTTNGGLRGTIVMLRDDSVVLKMQPDGVRLEFTKSAIAAVTTADAA